jgi:hypothetical protein
MIVRAHRAKTTASVSVVIPCYNYGRYLPGAVASALEQPGVDVDVIIVDDASTDGSEDVALGLAAADPRVRAVIHETNMRHIATYNDGLSRAEGTYVVLLSADDLLAPGSLQRSTALMEAHPDVGLVYGYAPDFTDSPPRPRDEVRNWSVWPGRAWLRRICRRGTNIIVNPEAMLRASTLTEVGGYDPKLPHSADMDLWMRAALVANVGRVNGPDQAYYRVHGANMHLTDYAGLLTDMKERSRTFDQFFASADGSVRGGEAMLASARRAIAYEAVRVARMTHDDAAGAAALADFAVDCYPRIASTAIWIAYRSRAHGPLRDARRSAAAFQYDLRWRYRWRRTRRFGT